MFLVWGRLKAVMILWDNEASFAKVRNKSQTHKEEGCDDHTWVERACDSEMLVLHSSPSSSPPLVARLQ